jgi:hypothetical protein
MTKTGLIIGILKLGEKLDKEEGVDALMTITDMEDLCDEFLKDNK